MRESPRIDADAPVTREQEELLSRHYGWAAWWSEPATSVGLLGTGPLSEPVLPDLPGLERFEGRAFHSAHWDHGVDLTGRRVAVIGTGASAVFEAGIYISQRWQGLTMREGQ